MERTRPTPEQILARIHEEEAHRSRGRLKIFLGMAAGVGKTYKMLEAAQMLTLQGTDCVAGLIVTHDRKETEVLLKGLALIPPRTIEYRGSLLTELDLDLVLERKPALVLVDELAHTNAPGCRHQKRWEDVNEILQAGIDVYTTLNIQHVESLNDVVAQITGVRIMETVPDSVVDGADEIELVDLPPDELIQRLREGKIYIPERAQRALENFFNKGNLIALRELSLRVTAERVDAQMLKHRQQTGTQDVWAVTERLLVCVGPSPLSVRLVRAAKRLATSLNASWIAVYVETPGLPTMSDPARSRIRRTLEIAQRLGAETDRISGNNVAGELVSYAKRRNVSKIVIGKPARPRWREVLFGSVVDELIRRSGVIDVYVITGDTSSGDTAQSSYQPRTINWNDYGKTVFAVGIATVTAKLSMWTAAPLNVAMLYMLAVLMVALRYGQGPSLFASALAVGAFDFFFIPPYYSFSVLDTQYVFTFAVMFIVGAASGALASQVKAQERFARKKEAETAALYAMAKDQATAMGTENVVKLSIHHISKVFDCRIAVLLSDDAGKLHRSEDSSLTMDLNETGVAEWVYVNKLPAGAGTTTLSGAKALWIPLVGSSGAIGTFGVLPENRQRLRDPDQMHLLETFVNQMALAVERAQLSDRRRVPRKSRLEGHV